MPDTWAEAKAAAVRAWAVTWLTDQLDQHAWSVTRTALAIGVCRERLHVLMRTHGIKRKPRPKQIVRPAKKRISIADLLSKSHDQLDEMEKHAKAKMNASSNRRTGQS